MKFNFTLFAAIFIFLNILTNSAKSLEIIRDTELENFTNELITKLIDSHQLDYKDLNIYFVKSDQINAFVTGGKNMFINTEILIQSDDYREYAAVIAHELAHILGGHIFNTTLEISDLSNKALPIYLLGIISIVSGASDSGLAGVMVGQATVSDGFTYYSRTQEASADQAAVNILCKSGIEGIHLTNFLKKVDSATFNVGDNNQNYRSTHPSIDNRISWVNMAYDNNHDCKFTKDETLDKKFKLLKAKLHGFTHPYNETESVYSGNEEVDLYATAVSNYFLGNHSRTIKNLEILLKNDPFNPYYKELIGEVYFANHNFIEAAKYQKEAIENIDQANDLYNMMLGNYLLSHETQEKANESILFLKKSIQINPKNAYSWYLLARAYAQVDKIPLANYATAERYFLIGEKELSFNFAIKALKNIEENTPEWYRSNDLIEILKKDVSSNR